MESLKITNDILRSQIREMQNTIDNQAETISKQGGVVQTVCTKCGELKSDLEKAMNRVEELEEDLQNEIDYSSGLNEAIRGNYEKEMR